MAARNNSDSQRFVYRSPDKESEPYFIPVNRSGSLLSQPPVHPRPTVIRSADSVTPRTEVSTPPRRVVVIRNTKNPQPDQGPVDLGDFGKPNAPESTPVFTDGNKSVFLIRRHISPPERQKPVESSQPVEELPSITTTTEDIRTPTPPQEILPSEDPPRSPSPQRSPPTRPKSSKRYAPYLRPSRSKVRTPSPVQTNPIRRSPSPIRKRPKPSKRHSPPPPQQEETIEIDHQPDFITCYWIEGSPQSANSPPPVITEHEEELIQYHPVATKKTTPRKKTASSRPKSGNLQPKRTTSPPKASSPPPKPTSSRPKSAKSLVFVNPDDQSIVVVENSFVQGEPLKPVVKRPKSHKKTRFDDEIKDESTENLVKRSRWQTCLGCLSRHMCLILIIFFILVIIGLAGAAVSIYYLATNSSTYFIPKIVGIAVGGALILLAFCLLCTLLGCIGARDGYFKYNDEGPHIGGRAFALIPPSHPHAHLYIPRDYMRMVENSHPPPPPIASSSSSNVLYRQPTVMQPVTTIPYSQQQTVHRSNTTTTIHETKSNKSNITIEMPERLVTGRKMSPRTRERSLNTVVKNIGHIVQDAKKRYPGETPSKVIVKVDPNAT